MNKWLMTYDYRISMNNSSFMLAGGLALLLVILTVSSQAFSAANMSPIKSLRTE